MKKFFKRIATLALVMSITFFSECLLIFHSYPTIYNVTDDSDITFSNFLPMKICNTDRNCFSEANQQDFIKNIRGKLKLFDIFPVKNVEMRFNYPKNVIPCGTPFGVKLYTFGPLVINVSDVKTEIGTVSPAYESGLKKSDIITSINGKKVSSNEEIADLVETSEGQAIKISVLRNGENLDLDVKPVKCKDDKKYKIGIWIRDSSGGIGTLTFYDEENGGFSGLGHGICDVDTGVIFPLERGEIMDASINGILPSEKGKPGELKGSFMGAKPIGDMSANTKTGVYGKLNNAPISSKPLKIAMKQQVKTGSAKMITTIDGKNPQYFDINIESINYNENNPTKNILISIEDKKLNEKAGGIVQGMSGSPIIQNDMLVGAVTHVFINSPKKGYAIFAETMMVNLNNIVGQTSKIYK